MIDKLKPAFTPVFFRSFLDQVWGSSDTQPGVLKKADGMKLCHKCKLVAGVAPQAIRGRQLGARRHHNRGTVQADWSFTKYTTSSVQYLDYFSNFSEATSVVVT